jgi:hypothetical protein
MMDPLGHLRNDFQSLLAEVKLIYYINFYSGWFINCTGRKLIRVSRCDIITLLYIWVKEVSCGTCS